MPQVHRAILTLCRHVRWRLIVRGVGRKGDPQEFLSFRYKCPISFTKWIITLIVLMSKKHHKNNFCGVPPSNFISDLCSNCKLIYFITPTMQSFKMTTITNSCILVGSIKSTSLNCFKWIKCISANRLIGLFKRRDAIDALLRVSVHTLTEVGLFLRARSLVKLAKLCNTQFAIYTADDIRAKLFIYSGSKPYSTNN